ncbi:ATP-binding protein [Actinoplanes sp. NPDC023936]|uniref:ATP-binding protein n=1 Tax=Actinoplanes sp. NPDC023936 TaxID=3154910 RepID=UPI0033E41D4B
MSVLRRLHLGFAALLLLFAAFLVVQFAVGGKVRSDHEDATARITAARLANDRVLQRMTDAETGVRGFQLTGDRSFLEPYENGRAATLAALDEVAAGTRDAGVRQMVSQEGAVVGRWLEQYADAVATSDQPGDAVALAARGKQIFDELRLVNEAVGEAIAAELRAEEHSWVTVQRLVNGGSVVLLAAILMVAYLVASTARRKLFAPLDQLGRTIRRLAEGDRSARAQPVEAVELRTVVDALNDLAAQTEELLAGEQARADRAGLRQAVAAELQDVREPTVAVRRIAELIGAAVTGTGTETGTETGTGTGRGGSGGGIGTGSGTGNGGGSGNGSVHCALVIPGAGTVQVQWPDGTRPLSEAVAGKLLAGAPGRVLTFDDGAIGVTIGGDADCEAGFLLVSRPGRRTWADGERRLLVGTAGALERVLRQLTLQYRQTRLITELRMLDHRKDVFIQTVTHELRTPLTSILGYTEMLTEDTGDLSPVQQRSLSAITRNAHRLHETIADLVLLDRPDTAGFPAAPLDLGELAAMVHTELENAARAKSLSVGFEAEPCWVLGDRTQLQRALRKLMENAIKFTPPGGSVRCELTTGADGRSVSVSVTDTGIGIPAEDVPGLFTPFHRAGNAMDQAVQGPGLGLAIVRDIVSDHGGTIAVQSVLGRGSTFTITLPAVTAPVPQSVPVG